MPIAFTSVKDNESTINVIIFYHMYMWSWCKVSGNNDYLLTTIGKKPYHESAEITSELLM